MFLEGFGLEGVGCTGRSFRQGSLDINLAGGFGKTFYTPTFDKAING
jgi:hypothetical protein